MHVRAGALERARRRNDHGAHASYRGRSLTASLFGSLRRRPQNRRRQIAEIETSHVLALASTIRRAVDGREERPKNRRMKRLVFLFVALAVGCAEQPATIHLNVDSAPSEATVTAIGTRDRIDVTVVPEATVLAGERLGTLTFRISLLGAIDCPGECLETPVRVWLDGTDTTVTFAHGGATYQIQPIVDPVTQSYYQFADVADPLHLPRGRIHGFFDFFHLDADGAWFQAMLIPLLDVGIPDDADVHQIAAGPIYATF